MVDEPTRAAGEEPFERCDEQPQFVGPFRLLERIGAGGMGVVHLAERREPVAQRVALKVIRTDRLDRTYRARFAMEQDALARMDHPNIARLLDAGDSNGQSWFAMEFVPGQPLTDYCREHRLSVEQRLQLFVQICDGVQHAHIKGILHRDLKPGNILVREVDGRPVAKIIDFGLAQPVDPLQIRATLHEAVQQVVGTFAYMSPEQATRTEGDLDTRTDVYSLGAVLYELLTGELPLDLDDVKRRGLQWFGTFLREHEPPKPSTRLSELGERLPSTAAERATSPARLQSSVRGDLDWVTMKALARDRQRRYLTVRDLGREVERVLAHRPVEAGPPSAWYVARKWVRRLGVGVGVAGVLVLFAAVAILLTERARASEMRRDLVARGLLVAEYVRRAEEDLWPANETMVADMDTWLAEAPAFENADAALAAYELELAADARNGSAPLAGPQVELVRRGRKAIEDLRRLKPLVERRLGRAKTLRQRTLVDYRDRWEKAREQLATDPRFSGFALLDLPGLVPLGRNDQSGLQEFYLLDSAGSDPLPTRRADGRFEVTAFTGLVLVLIPPAPGRAAPARPFLMSRYEMTQAQWARLRGDGLTSPVDLAQKNPSNEPPSLQRTAFGPSEARMPEDRITWEAVTWIHPVQQVAWDQVDRLLPRWGLRLPTSAEWLHAAAGGAAAFEWLGDEPRHYLNCRELDGVLADAGTVTGDGFIGSSPVGALLPNPYGLHDIFGNVAELCSDGYDESMPDRTTADARGCGRAVGHGLSYNDPWPPRDPARLSQTVIGNVWATVGFRPVLQLP
jgi:tRNA A-37 threonylcarbamoyl transferase component Bud32